MVVEKLEMVETRSRNLEELLTESQKNGEVREDRIAQLELRVMKLEQRGANDFEVAPGSIGEAASGEWNDWVTLDKKDHESAHLPEAEGGRKKKGKECESTFIVQ